MNIKVPYFAVGPRETLAALFMTSGYWYKENDYSLEKHKSWLVILICALIVALGTMCWQCGMLNLTWQKVIPYYLSALAGTLMVYTISNAILKIEKLKKVMVFVGNHTLEILTWHFLSFKLVSLLIIWLYSLPTSRLAEFPVIEEYSYDGWWIAYLLIGVIIPIIPTVVKKVKYLITYKLVLMKTRQHGIYK